MTEVNTERIAREVGVDESVVSEVVARLLLVRGDLSDDWFSHADSQCRKDESQLRGTGCPRGPFGGPHAAASRLSHGSESRRYHTCLRTSPCSPSDNLFGEPQWSSPIAALSRPGTWSRADGAGWRRKWLGSKRLCRRSTVRRRGSCCDSRVRTRSASSALRDADPLRWASPEIVEALFLSARPVRVIPEPQPPGGPRRRATRSNRRRNGPPG